MNRKVIIDTDPGIDDILAIATAYRVNDFDIIGLSTVSGNVSLEKTSRNAALTLDILGVKTPLYIGSEKSLTIPVDYDSNVHGQDGMGDLYQTYRDKTESIERERGSLFDLAKLIASQEEPITIIALGPLTNIAKLLIIDPEIKQKIAEIHIMGGGLKQGNTTVLSEFNFYCDSIAAQMVIQSGIKIYLSALDATSKVYFTEAEYQSFKPTSKIGEFVRNTVVYYMNLDPYMHDVLAVSTLSQPDLFTFTKKQLNVLVSPGIGDGMLYEDKTDNTSNVYFVDVKSREAIVDYVFGKIKQYDKE